ncbi:hypothetical protein D3C80_1776610 [compost metagenome]
MIHGKRDLVANNCTYIGYILLQHIQSFICDMNSREWVRDVVDIIVTASDFTSLVIGKILITAAVTFLRDVAHFLQEAQRCA